MLQTRGRDWTVPEQTGTSTTWTNGERPLSWQNRDKGLIATIPPSLLGPQLLFKRNSSFGENIHYIHSCVSLSGHASCSQAEDLVTMADIEFVLQLFCVLGVNQYTLYSCKLAN